MTEQEINIAVAACLGSKWHEPSEDEVKSGTYYQYAPDFTKSLDLCASFEKTLTFEEFWPHYYDYLGEPVHYDQRKITCATPLQRCEAFLRVRGVWKD